MVEALSLMSWGIRYIKVGDIAVIITIIITTIDKVNVLELLYYYYYSILRYIIFEKQSITHYASKYYIILYLTPIYCAQTGIFRDDKREGRGDEYLEDTRIYKGTSLVVVIVVVVVVEVVVVVVLLLLYRYHYYC